MISSGARTIVSSTLVYFNDHNKTPQACVETPRIYKTFYLQFCLSNHILEVSIICVYNDELYITENFVEVIAATKFFFLLQDNFSDSDFVFFSIARQDQKYIAAFVC